MPPDPRLDTEPLDTGALDTGALDTGALDTGALDTEPLDTGALDTEAIAEQVFAALADPTRRAILAALASGGPATATDLAERLPITRQAIGKHLALLGQVGLVRAEPGERRRVRYRLRSVPMRVAQQFLAALARDWDDPLDALRKHLDRSARGPATTHHTTREDIMTENGFTTTFAVDRTPTEAFGAITDVRGWWSEEIDGRTDRPGAEFTYRFEDVHRCRIRVTEAVPGRRVSWLVVDNYFNFTRDETEWTGTTISFDIAERGCRTEVRFTHQGLVPADECFGVCTTAWGFYVNGSLQSLITTGEGQPNGRGRPRLPSAEVAAGHGR